MPPRPSSSRHAAAWLLASILLIGCGGGASSSTEALELDDAPAQPSTDSGPIAEPGTPTGGTQVLRVAKAGAGQVRAVPAGIDCGPACDASYDAGATVTLSATAAPGSDFEGWGGACSGSQSTCNVTVQDSVTVTVSFVSQVETHASVDDIIAAMPPNSWKALAHTQMKDVCPPPYQRYACESVMAAWSGGAYDEKRDRMIVYGGGHGDSWYNNIFAFDLPSMKWHRLSEMSTATGTEPGVGWRDHRIETCGFYPKGLVTLSESVMKGNYVDHDQCDSEVVASQLDFQQPRSSHTYGKVFVDTINDRYCYLAGGYYPSAQAMSRRVVCFDPVSRRWSRAAEQPATVHGRGSAARDASGHIWYLTDASGPIGRYDPTSNSWTTFGQVHGTAGGSADIDRRRHHFHVLVARDDGTHVLRRWDLRRAGVPSAQAPAVDLPTLGEAPKNLGARPGFVYADDEDRFYAWGGGRTIHVFDPSTGRWSRREATGDDPGEPQQWGTYGRFRYSATRKVFVLANRTTQNVFIYKP